MDSSDQAGSELESLQEIPPDQAHYFEDRQITLTEYQDAFAEFDECAEAAGSPIRITDTDERTGQVVFEAVEPVMAAGAQMFDRDGNPFPAPANPTNSCYQQHFDKVKMWFDLYDPTVLAAFELGERDSFLRNVAPCLRENGIAVPDDIQPGSAEFIELFAEFDALLAQDRCTDASDLPADS